ncbi:hypothetical protein EJ06DRAFT_488310 [Trichodelitschia bisporula]|uniref:DNA-directed RNA polymerase subunit n=1 Tax=Trichodelitschia bisporula TaxID=703511 RepID=A0A6G1I5V8_9PEZI|nr:hypothetical protein EJ06DRAFT_488310 [Trichodelitschia bisporula]
MLLFCPHCSNMLTVTRVSYTDPDTSAHGRNRFECRTCPYSYQLEKRYYERKTFKRKEVDDILGGKGAWDNVDKTQVQCPSDTCDSTMAYFYQLQIRSADEPMTSFFKCCDCGKMWRE